MTDPTYPAHATNSDGKANTVTPVAVINNPEGVLTREMDYAGTANLTYFGQAVPGSLTSAAVWQISKFTYDGAGNPAGQLWAGGSGSFSNAWDNRASLSYS